MDLLRRPDGTVSTTKTSTWVFVVTALLQIWAPDVLDTPFFAHVMETLNALGLGGIALGLRNAPRNDTAPREA